MKKRSRDDTDENSRPVRNRRETQAVVEAPLVNLGKRTREDQPERRVAPSQRSRTPVTSEVPSTRKRGRDESGMNELESAMKRMDVTTNKYILEKYEASQMSRKDLRKHLIKLHKMYLALEKKYKDSEKEKETLTLANRELWRINQRLRIMMRTSEPVPSAMQTKLKM